MKHKTRRILIVDDNRDNLTLLQAQMQKIGLEVMVSTSAPKAIETTIREQPDVILLEWSVSFP